MATTSSPATVETLIVIPARYDSGRLPGKALATIGDDPMVWHVVERARSAGVGGVIVATDDERIAGAVRSRGGRVVLTTSSPRNGTERVAEVARAIPDVDIVINLQGDEPLFDPAAITALCQTMITEPSTRMATVAFPLESPDLLDEPSVVKVEVDGSGRAVAFWRTPPPSDGHPVYHHAGIYAFRREALLCIAAAPPTPGEQRVSLEQLRAMDLGVEIRVVLVDGAWPSVNTHQDLERVRRTFAAEGGRT